MNHEGGFWNLKLFENDFSLSLFALLQNANQLCLQKLVPLND